MTWKTTFAICCAALSGIPGIAQPGRHSNVIPPARHDVSPPLREIHVTPAKRANPYIKEHEVLPRPRSATTAQSDPVAQVTSGPMVGTTSNTNLVGVGTGFVGPAGAYSVDAIPPDTNGAPGETQYVQWVNTSFAVFSKSSGAPIYGPVPGNALWTGFGGACEADNDGDPVVKYDHIAGRWVMSQLAVSSGPPYYQCIAVSTTNDATGSYNRFAYQFSNLNDYPKLSVWPDAYYISFNLFQGTTFLGAEACALDRNQMLVGGAATMQCFQLDPTFGAVLPSDLDGATPPPSGAPNFFLGIGSAVVDLWKFHVDFTTPANSSLTGPTAISVAPYNDGCNGGTCIPQSGTTQQLDSLGDRPMYRLAYRNFADHEALTATHTVSSGPITGMRWYEIRNPSTSPTLYQQGTYTPDSAFRWMGSIAMDKVGNIALGYSVSSRNMHPSIRYTGRVPSDPLGTMQAETSVIEGTGSQLPYFGQALSRWGDYSSMAIDPVDDCTFWYTNQYLTSNGSFNWSTRIASFSFPSCTAAPPPQDFYLTLTPVTQQIARGSSGTFSVSITPTGGFTGNIGLAASNLPAGVTATFNPTSVTGSGSATLTVNVSAAAANQPFNFDIIATSGNVTHSANASVNVFTPAAAVFLKYDTATQGTWKGIYGSNGETIVNDSTNFPAYAQVAVTGPNTYTWASPTTDVRALQSAVNGNRIASTWDGSSFTIDINLADGNTHQVGMYAVDWDNLGRAETISVADGMTAAVLDTRSISSFTNGEWLVWNLTGHVKITVTQTGSQNAVISGLFFDPPGVLMPDFTIAATPASQTIGRSASTTYTVTVSPESGFAGTVTLSASGLPSGATASFNPTSIVGSGTSTMTVTTDNTVSSGTYPITVTGTTGTSTHATTLTLVAKVAVAAAAAFVKYDPTTQGTWKGVYGSNGETIVNDSTNYPAYAQVTVNGAYAYTWASPTTDVRALQSAASTGRIASTWDNSSFTIDINLTDSNTHEVAMYAVDWDNIGRAETITVADAASGAVLDSRSISSFANGEWLVWNLTGHVKITVTQTGNQNAVISGLFFDAPAVLMPDFNVSAAPVSQTIGRSASTTYTVTASTQGGFAGTVTLSASGLPGGATAGFSTTSIANSGTATLKVTTDNTVSGGTYPITITGTSGSLTHTTTVTLVVKVVAAAAAVFVKYDTATQGTWKGVYGSNGETIVNDSTNYPAYAQVTVSGANSYTWASTTDVRALQSAVTTGRIASTWYSSGFTLDINLSDGNTHQVEMYAVDWDGLGRAETITVADAASGAVLDSRGISSFTSGEWIVWNLTGHVKITVTQTGNQNAVVSGLFFDPAGVLAPDFSVTATPASQTIGRSAGTSYTVNVSAQSGFAGTVTLSASGLPSGATATLNPTSIDSSGTSTLTITTDNTVSGGSYPITITSASGTLTHTATVTLVVKVVIPAAAVFLKSDATTQGTWKGVYGSNGWAIVNDSTNYPAYVQVTVSGANAYTWASPTTDVRALQSGVNSGRIATTWYSSGFTVDMNLTDGNTHQVALYALDWDGGRAETISIADATSGAVLDSRSISNFTSGEWLIWNLTGHVRITVTQTGSLNAVVSGLFFDAAGALMPDFAVTATPATQSVGRSSSTTYTVTISPQGGFAGTVTLSASGVPGGATAGFSPASINSSGTSTLTITTDNTLSGGTYPITITGTSGTSTHTATVTLVAKVVAPAAAAFVKYDTASQGTWKGVYGSNGAAIVNDSTNYPAYAQVTVSGAYAYTWAGSTTDVRALQSAVTTTRIASTWYNSSFTIDLNLADGNTHQVAMYAVDWDNLGRADTISIADATSGTVLDSRSISGFTNGEWVVWNLTGHLKITVTQSGNQNAVVSGLFFDAPH